MNASNLATPSAVANKFSNNNLYVPCVPISVSVNLVAASTLAKRLSVAVLETSPALVKTSLTEFAEIQRKKSELRLKTDECSITNEALLDVCLLNIEDAFSHLVAYLLARGRVAESMENQNAQDNAQISLNLVHEYAAAVGLIVTDYCVDGEVQPEMLFAACLKRVEMLQKRWQDNYFESMDLALQLQRDSVFGAVAACLSVICQHGLENQITLEPMPQTQTDVLGALATCVDFPFSDQWPKLREHGIVFDHQGKAIHADSKGGVQ